MAKWLGLDDVKATLSAQVGRIAKLELLLEAEQQKVKELQFKRSIAQKPEPMSDWESVQAAYAANPENFKEVN